MEPTTPPHDRDAGRTPTVHSTRTLRFDGDEVTKRFRGEDGAERAAAEWRALRLLHRHAPGLAPEPLSAPPTADRPHVVMSRLDGLPLRGTPVDGRRLRALAAAVTRLHTAVPAHEVAALTPRPGGPDQLAAEIRVLAPHVRRLPAARAAGRETTDMDSGPRIVRAMDEGLAWLDTLEPVAGAFRRAADVPAVLGHGDGNLANYLWDGTRVAVLDFEFAGAADRPLELAEITEHVAAWTGPPLDAGAFLGRFDLTPGERRRLTLCRRLLALHWLCRLALDDPARPRNPPGTAGRQAVRLEALLAGE
ncbi:phosphotransferase family protein [Actinacidiphila acidipaludis]|uniref:Phosphotransferase n=1 Tax=Actinacidiphila acidipaludis TaxID=2873382 RepID=A0ABS7Q002_9ACTN|nr:phosphotransferase [Streptomyces acidipaludis]MBY8876460.1 phosphotransferase [Streptomyces acidipaludis]